MFEIGFEETDESILRRLENKRNNQRFDYLFDTDDWRYVIVEYYPDEPFEQDLGVVRDSDDAERIVKKLNKECEKKELYTMNTGRYEYDISGERIKDIKQEKELTFDDVCRLLNGYDKQQVNLVGKLNKLYKENWELETKNTDVHVERREELRDYKLSLRSVLVKHMGDINLTEDQNQILIQVMNDLRNNNLLLE